MPIKTVNLSHVYSPDTPYRSEALVDVNIEIADGEFVAVIGHTGSGKSTLIQHLNGLIRPTSGGVYVDDMQLFNGADMKQVRKRVGLVFQYPEYQLFEETIAKDVAFGPKNLGLAEDEVETRVQAALTQVELDFETYKDQSPFDLSGGQKRRLAIAGVLAMDPQVLILDEPTAGLDPRGRDEILRLISTWHKSGKTILMVSHSMDDVSRLAGRIIVMQNARVAMQGTPKEVFKNAATLRQMGLGVPSVCELGEALREKGFDIPKGIYTMGEMEQAVYALLGGDRDV